MHSNGADWKINASNSVCYSPCNRGAVSVASPASVHTMCARCSHERGHQRWWEEEEKKAQNGTLCLPSGYLTWSKTKAQTELLHLLPVLSERRKLFVMQSQSIHQVFRFFKNKKVNALLMSQQHSQAELGHFTMGLNSGRPSSFA